MIEVTSLQANDAVGDVHDARGDAIRAVTVNDPAVAFLPEERAETLGRTDEQEVVDLVEVPLVEQELVENAMLIGIAALVTWMMLGSSF